MERILGFKPVPVQFQPKLLSIVIPRFLYLTDYHAVKKEDVLKKHNITHIITCLKVAVPLYPREKYKQLIIPVNDRIGENIGKYFKKASEFIEEAREEKGKVVVHCWGGVSRSSSIIICYLMYKYKLDYESCYQLVRSMKPDIHPNESFKFQLKKWSKQVTKQNQDKLEDIKKAFCKLCRSVLFTESEVVDHNRVVKKNEEEKKEQECNSIFVFERLLTFDYQSKGKKCQIRCKKCNKKIGRFTQMGDICSCGGRIIIPVYQITESNIDFT